MMKGSTGFCTESLVRLLPLGFAETTRTRKHFINIAIFTYLYLKNIIRCVIL